jgi:hypothetical protein
MTLSQRYRGTEWGQPLDPAPAPPKRGRRGARSVVLVLLVAGALAAIGGWTALGGRLPALPGIGASPSPAKPNSLVAQRFLKVVTKPPLTFHVAYRATLKAANQTAAISGDLDVSGADFAGATKIQRGGARVAMDVVYKAGRAYGRLPKANWTVIPPDELATPANPFHVLSATSSLEDLGDVTRAGKKLRRLRTGEWLAGDPNRLLAGQPGTVKVDSSTFDIFVTAAGVPVEALLSARLSGELGGKPGAASLTATYTFTKVGTPVKISAPKLR